MESGSEWHHGAFSHNRSVPREQQHSVSSARLLRFTIEVPLNASPVQERRTPRRRITMPTSKLFPTRNDLAPTVREQAVQLLNQHLADTTDLYSQTKQAHWNVKGLHFYQLHLLFDTLAEAVEEYIDLIAERTAALGGTALGTVRQSAGRTRLPEYQVDVT